MAGPESAPPLETGWSRARAGGATLVGFSLGGFVALDVAEHASGEWPLVMPIGARVAPSARRLERAGVKSILFASGDWDRARQPMREGARHVARFAPDIGWLEGS